MTSLCWLNANSDDIIAFIKKYGYSKLGKNVSSVFIICVTNNTNKKK